MMILSKDSKSPNLINFLTLIIMRFINNFLFSERTLENKIQLITLMLYSFISRGAVVEWLEQLGYSAESRRIA